MKGGQSDYGRSQIHVLGTFNSSRVSGYDRGELHDFIKTMLDDEDILYSAVLSMESEDGVITIQCKLQKSAINKGAIDDISEIFRGLDGYVDTWVSTDTAMNHPEIYR